MAPTKRTTSLDRFQARGEPGPPQPESISADERGAVQRAVESPPFFTVSELTDLIEEKLTREPRFQGVWVKGEIAGLRAYPKAWYFTLKDEGAELNAVVWNFGAGRFAGEMLKEGAEVIARGDINVYKKRGEYQLRVTEVVPTDKRGALFLKFEQTKKKLAAEGLFDEALKRPIPRFPRTIGIVTSPEGAVIRDIINVTSRRFPHVRLLVAPAKVQGEGAHRDVIRGIELLNRFGGVDVIIVARGGGSIEDLWPFNEEDLARAVRASAVPVISAVGHETDFTICDFVADLRAPTPSAAAELVVPNARDVLAALSEYESRLERGLLHTRDIAAARLERLTPHPALRLPQSLLESRQQMLDEVTARLQATASVVLERSQGKLDRSLAALEVLSPLKTLARGYAIALAKDGRVIRGADEVDVGESVDVLLSEGELGAKVESKRARRLKGPPET